MKHVETITLPHDLSEFTEIIDVRSPSEFEEDHLPGAVNLPVLSDAERKQVGTLYKDNAFEGRRLGAGIISANIAHHLVTHFANKDKTYAPLLYCWRGGMRSGSMAHVLRSVGWRARLIQGGYKAFRKFIGDELELMLSAPKMKLTVLAGPTGVAKTRLLHTLRDQGAQILDLEGLANHRGSVLGLVPHTEQPSQKMFETRLWETLSSLDLSQPIFTEAESNRIGVVHCHPSLWRMLGSGDVVDVDMPLEQRAAFLLDDYPHFTDDTEHLKELLSRLTKIRGHEQVALWHQQIDTTQWQAFVTSILRDHYDLVYRRAGHEKSNYSAPCQSIYLSDFETATLRDAAQKLIERTSIPHTS
ncbi:MAG: tRNA 2-selenouridine(34) synthase MnmH [Akkermansiaceae bacterium]